MVPLPGLGCCRDEDEDAEAKLVRGVPRRDLSRWPRLWSVGAVEEEEAEDEAEQLQLVGVVGKLVKPQSEWLKLQERHKW